MKTLKQVFEGFEPSYESHIMTSNMEGANRSFAIDLARASESTVNQLDTELRTSWEYRTMKARAEALKLNIDLKVFIYIRTLNDCGIGGLLLNLMYTLWYDKRKSLCYSAPNYSKYAKKKYDIEYMQVVTNLGPVMLVDKDIHLLWTLQKSDDDKNLIDNTEQVQEIIKYSRELMK